VKICLQTLFLTSAVLALLSPLNAYAEEECEDAVDMADSHDFEDFHACHKEKTGINRLLNQMMKGDVKSTSDSDQPVDKTNYLVVPKAGKPSGEASPQSEERVRALVIDAQSLSAQRVQLLQKMINECPGGFHIEAERYEPSEAGMLQLNYQYRCL